MAVRRINEPVPAQVILGANGRPEQVQWQPHSARQGALREDHVEHVVDIWYVDDAWWTDTPVRRMYHELQMAGGARLIAVYDLVAERWFVQR